MRLEIKYQKGTYDVSGFNSDIDTSSEGSRLRGLKAGADAFAGVLRPSPNPFDKHWLNMGTSLFSWWSILGCDPEATGKEALDIKRTDGPYAIVCLN